MVSIDEKRSSNQKIQIDIAVNLIHLTKKDRITFYVKSKNVACYPSSDSNDILNQLYESLLEYFNEKLLVCRTDTSYVFESIEGFSIHFHKTDLRRASSCIPSPSWIEFKKAVVNPINEHGNFCFAYAATIAIYHKELGKNPSRISNQLIKYTEKLD